MQYVNDFLQPSFRGAILCSIGVFESYRVFISTYSQKSHIRYNKIQSFCVCVQFRRNSFLKNRQGQHDVQSFVELLVYLYF